MFKTKKEFALALMEGRKFTSGIGDIIYYDKSENIPFRYENKRTGLYEPLNSFWNLYNNNSLKEIKRKIDWSKVPAYTKVLVSDTPDLYLNESEFIAYVPDIKFPFIAKLKSLAFGFRGWKYCKIDPSVEIKEEWYKQWQE